MADEKRWKTAAIASTAVSIVLITGIIIVYWWSSTTVVLIVRHGERDDTTSCPPTPNNPPLSTAGQQRAGVLAHVGEDTELQAICQRILPDAANCRTACRSTGSGSQRRQTTC